MNAAVFHALTRASEVVRNNFGTVFDVRMKGNNPQDIVTDTDLASEKIILDTLRAAFPDFGFFSEEAGSKDVNAPYVWMIDPLDGTTNFTRAIPCVSISIALVKNKEIILGAVANPLTNEVYYAEKGKGAFLNGEPIHVSSNTDLAKAFVCAEWWSRSGEYKERGVKIFNMLAERCAKIRYLSGVVWGLTRVACGLFDIETCDTTLLDVAAMSLIIKEAGGLLTDEHGEELHPFDMVVKRIVAANPILHKQVLGLIKKVVHTEEKGYARKH